jgi:serine/threonine protein kinase
MIDGLAALEKSHDLVPSREPPDEPGLGPASPDELQDLDHAGATDNGTQPAKDEPPSRLLPARIGTYLVIAPLNSSRDAQVYLVRQSSFGGELVLKLFPQRAPADWATRDSLRREALKLTQIGHPNLLRIVDVDFHERYPFVVMQRIYSLPVAEYAEQRRPGPREAAGLVAELARAVTYLDALGIHDRDLTLRNVVIDETGRPRLMNFGLSRLREAWSDNGVDPPGISVAEALREHSRDDNVPRGAGTDVRDLGMILRHLLIERKPDQRTGTAVARRRANDGDHAEPCLFNPSIPSSLERICSKALAQDPKRRYQSVAQLEQALRRFRARPWLGAAVLAMLAVIALALVGRI